MTPLADTQGEFPGDDWDAHDEHQEVRRLRAFSVPELRQLPEPGWLVDDVIPECGLLGVVGPSSAGKTFVVLDLGMCVASGSEWFGRPVRRGGVVYVAADGYTQARVDAYMADRGLADDDLRRFMVVPESPNLLRREPDLPALVTCLIEAQAVTGRLALVMIDTLNAVMPGGDENSSVAMGRIIRAGQVIRRALMCTVVFVHHTGKDRDRGSRGHSCFPAALDAEITLSVKAGVRRAVVTKQRDGIPGLELPFALKEVNLTGLASRQHTVARATSCIVEPLDRAQRVAAQEHQKRALPRNAALALNALQKAIKSGGQPLPEVPGKYPADTVAVEVAAWRDSYYACEPLPADGDADGLRRATDTRKKRFQRAHEVLVDTGAVGTAGGWVWVA